MTNQLYGGLFDRIVREEIVEFVQGVNMGNPQSIDSDTSQGKHVVVDGDVHLKLPASPKRKSFAEVLVNSNANKAKIRKNDEKSVPLKPLSNPRMVGGM